MGEISPHLYKNVKKNAEMLCEEIEAFLSEKTSDGFIVLKSYATAKEYLDKICRLEGKLELLINSNLKDEEKQGGYIEVRDRLQKKEIELNNILRQRIPRLKNR